MAKLTLSNKTRAVVVEDWFCPSCGKSSSTYVSTSRVLACTSCHWTFHIILGPYAPMNRNVNTVALTRAEQRRYDKEAEKIAKAAREILLEDLAEHNIPNMIEPWDRIDAFERRGLTETAALVCRAIERVEAEDE